MERLEGGIGLSLHEIAASRESETLFIDALRHFQVDQAAVPLTVVGDRVFLGYTDDASTGREIRAAIARCREMACEDVIVRLEAAVSQPDTAPPPSGRQPASSSLPETLDLPLIGTVSTAALSLPVLTVVLAAIDGFNPCAMWVLVFLIGLLLGMRDSLRMWTLGFAFLFATAAVYFAVMAAWLNVILVLSAIVWIRIAVGLVAIVGGGYYVREFFVNPESACKVTGSGQRQRIMARARAVVSERRFLVALVGVVVLAVAVNMVELICSAGIPAVYTQVLSLSAIPAWQHYAYLLLYVTVFLIDDILVFVTAMLTVKAVGATAVYARFSHIVGGVILIGIGMLLLFRPEWLTFA